MPTPPRRWITSSVVLSVLLAAITPASAEDWSRFRGPNGTGIVPDAGYPIEFGPSRNLKWRSAVRPGKSSPVLGRRHVFLTAYEGVRSTPSASTARPDVCCGSGRKHRRAMNTRVA